MHFYIRIIQHHLHPLLLNSVTARIIADLPHYLGDMFFLHEVLKFSASYDILPQRVELVFV